MGKSTRARGLAQEALALLEGTGDQADISNVLAMLGSIALATGSQEEAATHFTESYAVAKRAEGSYERATRLAAAAAALRSAAHTPLPPTEQEDFDKVVMSARAELDERVFTEQWDIGSTLAQDDAISYALIGLPK